MEVAKLNKDARFFEGTAMALLLLVAVLFIPLDIMLLLAHLLSFLILTSTSTRIHVLRGKAEHGDRRELEERCMAAVGGGARACFNVISLIFLLFCCVTSRLLVVPFIVALASTVEDVTAGLSKNQEVDDACVRVSAVEVAKLKEDARLLEGRVRFAGTVMALLLVDVAVAFSYELAEYQEVDDARVRVSDDEGRSYVGLCTERCPESKPEEGAVEEEEEEEEDWTAVDLMSSLREDWMN